MGRHLGIDFSLILVDFGRQVGRQNRAKTLKNGIKKTMEKWKATRWPKSRYKTLQPRAAERVLGPGEVNPFRLG